jgi:phosphopantothenoylcysteine decarboxylase / phosphopantothenate---cysteine ligase
MSFNRFKGKTLALGITGSIAAYKSLELIRTLQREGAERVCPLLTPNAVPFVTPLSLEMLSGQPVWGHELALTPAHNAAHIDLAQQADALIIYPCSANTLAKLAAGLADNIVTTTALTFTGKPVLIVPAMNTRMWQHPLTQANVERLNQLPQVTVMPPDEGLLACGEYGAGHLPAMERVLEYLYRMLHTTPHLLAGQNVVVTAGGTQAPIDAVRYLHNHSSGKMGLALADECWAMGAEVTLIAMMPTPPKPYTVIPAKTVKDLHHAMGTCVPQCHQLWMSAAVSDYRVANPALDKHKKSAQPLMLELVPEMDVLATWAARKAPYQAMIGFAAESTPDAALALAKCQRKGLDAIVLNDISRADVGFASDDNEVYFIPANNAPMQFIPKQPKQLVARQLLTLSQQHFGGIMTGATKLPAKFTRPSRH